MKISRQELEYLIEQEINEIFGFGGPATKEYPADAMVEITATIFSLADQAGVQTSPDERDEIVNEIERLLKDEGWRLHEQNLALGDELTLKIDNAPVLRALIDDIEAEIPGALNTIQSAFRRGGIQTDLPSSSPPEEEPEDDEDLTDTEVDLPPVDVPEEEPEPEEEEEEPEPEEEEEEPAEEEPAEDEPDSEKPERLGLEHAGLPRVKVGDVIRVHPDAKKSFVEPVKGGKKSFFSSKSWVAPGDYDVVKVWADERDLVDRETGEEVTLLVSDITLNPGLFKELESPLKVGDTIRVGEGRWNKGNWPAGDYKVADVKYFTPDENPAEWWVWIDPPFESGVIEVPQNGLLSYPEIFNINPEDKEIRESCPLTRMKVLAGIK